jgi:hypothetical protein
MSCLSNLCLIRMKYERSFKFHTNIINKHYGLRMWYVLYIM